MGNCFKAASTDGFSLLRDSAGADTDESSTPSIHSRSTMPPPYQDHASTPENSHLQSRSINPSTTNLTEEEQIRIAKRIGLINHLPSATYDGNMKLRECAVCMGDFVVGDSLRFLPCLHTYHRECIDDWMMRSFTCPSCMEPIDAALLMTYQTN